MASAALTECAEQRQTRQALGCRDAAPSDGGRTLAARHERCLRLLLLLGVSLRAWHYLSNPSVWHDEAALIVNVIGKDFAELLGPLYFAEAAPPLFLWAEKSVTLLLGDGPRALRLLPFLASAAAVVLFTAVARRVLAPAAALAAVLLFSTADMLGWHACEAKSYAFDVLAAVLLIALASWPLRPRLAAYILLTPPLIFLAYPACFLYGGVLLALLPEVGQTRLRRPWLLYALLAVVVFASFALLVLGPVRAQRCELMTSDWLTKFPPWERPRAVPGWIAASTVEIARYGLKPCGQFLAPLAVVGAWQLWRHGQRRLLVLLVVPIALALVAAFLGAYPYGGSRVLAYAIPAVVLLIAAGTPPALAWLRERSRLAAAVLVVLLVVPAASGLHRAAVPWQRADAAGAAELILTQRRPDDAIVANDWEFAYYFRQFGAHFHLAPAQPLEPGRRLTALGNGRTGFTLAAHDQPAQAQRIWVVAKAPAAADRQAYLDALPAGEFHLRERYEFRRVTVVLLVRATAS